MHTDCSRTRAAPFSERLTNIFHAVLVAMVGWMTLGLALHIVARMV